MGLFLFLILHNNFINPHNTIVTIVIIVILHIRKSVLWRMNGLYKATLQVRIWTLQSIFRAWGFIATPYYSNECLSLLEISLLPWFGLFIKKNLPYIKHTIHLRNNTYYYIIIFLSLGKNMKLTHYTYIQILSWTHVFKDSEAKAFYLGTPIGVQQCQCTSFLAHGPWTAMWGNILYSMWLLYFPFYCWSRTWTLSLAFPLLYESTRLNSQSASWSLTAWHALT